MNTIKDSCRLCLFDIAQNVNKYRLEGRGKFVVLDEIKSLPFDVHFRSSFVCRECYLKLKRRRSLLSQLSELEKSWELAQYDNVDGISSLKRTIDEECQTPVKRFAKDRVEKSAQIYSTPISDTYCIPEITLSPILPSKTKTACKLTSNLGEKRRKTNADVTVKVEWPSKEMERKLSEDLESLGKMLVRGTYKQIANATWKHDSIRQ